MLCLIFPEWFDMFLSFIIFVCLRISVILALCLDLGPDLCCNSAGPICWQFVWRFLLSSCLWILITYPWRATTSTVCLTHMCWPLRDAVIVDSLWIGRLHLTVSACVWFWMWAVGWGLVRGRAEYVRLYNVWNHYSMSSMYGYYNRCYHAGSVISVFTGAPKSGPALILMRT